jgi:hypothetical protein
VKIHLYAVLLTVALFAPQWSSAALIPVQSVTASTWQEPNVPANALDGDPDTRWSAFGDGQWIQFDLGESVLVDRVDVAWYRGTSRRFIFDLQVSANALEWQTVHSGLSSGTTIELEPYSFDAVSAQYVRIVGHGNTEIMWNSITEVTISGGSELPPPSLSILEVTLAWSYSDPPPDLAGFRIHYGEVPGEYTEHVQINNPEVRSMSVPIPHTGVWYFAATAFDTSGNESEHSNRVAVIGPACPCHVE